MNISVKRTTPSDEHTVQTIFERAPGFFLRTDHSAVLSHFAKREMNDSPPKEKQSSTYEKVFCLICADNEPIGVIDIHKDHPKAGTAYIGLMLIEESFHGKGLGKATYEASERFIKDLGVSAIRLGVSQDNDVEGFWRKVGFTRNGNTYQWHGDSHLNEVFELEKVLS